MCPGKNEVCEIRGFARLRVGKKVTRIFDKEKFWKSVIPVEDESRVGGSSRGDLSCGDVYWGLSFSGGAHSAPVGGAAGEAVITPVRVGGGGREE